MEPNLASEVIEALGGTTKAAEAIGAPITTVHSWKQKGEIPSWRRESVKRAAEKVGATLPERFLRSDAA